MSDIPVLTLQELTRAKNVVITYLKGIDGLNSSTEIVTAEKNVLTDELIMKQKHIDYWKEKALDKIPDIEVNKAERKRINNNERSLVPYTETYKDDPEMLTIMENLNMWIESYGASTPSFGQGILGNTSTYMGNGTLAEISARTSFNNGANRDYEKFNKIVKEFLSNASAYQDRLTEILNSLNPDDFETPEEYQAQIDSINSDIKFWEKSKKVVVTEKEQDVIFKTEEEYIEEFGFVIPGVKFTDMFTEVPPNKKITFKNIELISQTPVPIDYAINTVYFDAEKREYVIMIMFTAPIDYDEAVNVSNYVIDRSDGEGNVIETLFIDTAQIYSNLQIVSLKTKFGIIPNLVYRITATLPNLIEYNSRILVRQVAPKIDDILYLDKTDTFSISFTSDIDINIEGIREETSLLLREVEAENKDNYRLLDSYGNVVNILGTILEPDMRIVTIIIDGEFQNRNGYTVYVKNLAYENGRIMKEEEHTRFVFSSPHRPLGLSYVVDGTVVLLGWLPNVEEDVAGYNIYRSKKDILNYMKINDVVIAQEKFADTGLEHGNSYYYMITAVNSVGDESVSSKEINVYIEKN